jgi:hypothetical protein
MRGLNFGSADRVGVTVAVGSDGRRPSEEDADTTER